MRASQRGFAGVSFLVNRRISRHNWSLKMKSPYKITQAADHVYSAGVSYHAHGTVMRGRTALFLFLQCDTISDTQVAKLRVYCPDMQVVGVRHKYAPEITRVHLLFPKAAWYRLPETERNCSAKPGAASHKFV